MMMWGVAPLPNLQHLGPEGDHLINKSSMMLPHFAPDFLPIYTLPESSGGDRCLLHYCRTIYCHNFYSQNSQQDSF